MIRLFHVFKNYNGGVRALEDVTLHLQRGAFVFLTGASGAGKSTLLKLIYGAERATRGQIMVQGRNITRLQRSQLPALRRNIGVVFQDFKLLSHYTIAENVALPLEVHGFPRSEMRKRVHLVLKLVGIPDKADRKPTHLSGGEQQRAAIARALINNPAVLLADEPTGNLDPDITIDIINILTKINSRGMTVVVATHDRDLVARFQRPMIMLRRGRVAEQLL